MIILSLSLHATFPLGDRIYLSCVCLQHDQAIESYRQLHTHNVKSFCYSYEKRIVFDDFSTRGEFEHAMGRLTTRAHDETRLWESDVIRTY